MSSQTAFSETLEGAVRSAVLFHPQVERAQARVEGAREEEASERSGYFPELSVSGTGGRIFGDNSTSRASQVTRDSTYSYLWEGSISAQQPIFDGFETMSRVDSARASKRSADLTLLDVREQLAFRTTQAYLNVAQARTTLGMLQEHQKKLDDYLSRIQNMVDEGAADEAEYQQARDVVVIIDGFVADYQGQLKTAESQYFELVGKPPEANMERPKLDMSLVPQSQDEAIILARESHPAVQSAQQSAKSAEHDIRAEKALLYPDLDGELSYLESDKKEEIGGEVADARAVLRLNWNFETGGGQLARIKQRKQEHQETLAQGREIERQIERDIRIAFAEQDVAARRFENQKERITLNKKLLDTYEIQFEGGTVRLLQLMQAENQLFTARLEKVITQYRLLTAQYGILASMGRLQNTILKTAPVNTAQAYEE